jgi:hypothetical protein
MARKAETLSRRQERWFGSRWAILVLPGLTALYAWPIRGSREALHRWGFDFAWGGSIVLATCLLGALARLTDALRAAEDRRILARCLAGAPPQDGKRFAVAGRLTALAAPLVAPLSGAPCVLCRYRVGGDDRPSEALPPGFAGVALAPSVVASERAGEVRLLGFPCLEGFPEAVFAGEAACDRAAGHVARTAFEDLGKAKPEKILGGDPWLAADAKGAVRRDWRIAGRLAVEPRDRLAETAVAEGAEVCAIGLFHAAEGGVAPDPSPVGRRLRLLRGDAAMVTAALAREGRGRALLGLALLLVPSAVYAAFLLLRR